MIGVSVSTLKRDWRYARAWLARWLGEQHAWIGDGGCRCFPASRPLDHSNVTAILLPYCRQALQPIHDFPDLPPEDDVL